MPEIEDIVETTETAPLLLWWHWALIALAVVIAIFIIRHYLKQKAAKRPHANNLKASLEQLIVISKKDLDDTELATELSRVTREYLQVQLQNKSLFQTHNEFVQDHSDLDHLPEHARTQLTDYLGVLANYKYIPDSSLSTEKEKLIKHTDSLLRSIDSTILRDL